MDLSGKNVIFIPTDTNSYRVYVRENDAYPPVYYTNHSKVSDEDKNNGKIPNNGFYRHDLEGRRFKFYNNNYDFIYVHENGYLNLIGGDNSLVIGNYANHFTEIRISAFLNNLENTSNDGKAEVYLGTGPYGEDVITYQNLVQLKLIQIIQHLLLMIITIISNSTVD